MKTRVAPSVALETEIAELLEQGIGDSESITRLSRSERPRLPLREPREAGMGKVSRTSASRICQELRARYAAFRARSLAKIDLLVLFLDAIYLPTRPSGAKGRRAGGLGLHPIG